MKPNGELRLCISNYFDVFRKKYLPNSNHADTNALPKFKES